jgi:NADH-quinone oxidoreductase subunit L
MSIATSVWVAYAAPLVGCVLIALLGFAREAIPRRVSSWLAVLALLVSFLFGVYAFVKLQQQPADQRVVHDTLWKWLQAGTFRVDVNILFDPLSAVMLLIVSGVGFLIHVYSVGYMQGDQEERRYFSYLNLFVFSMLVLVLSANFVLLLAGWGLVGLSSYLLIGFWHQRPSAVAAAKKAFIMNAVGDAAMALGIFLIFTHLHTVDYLQVFAEHSKLGTDTSTMNWICFLLLVGGLAKSAQLPLHTWLPDAMEGPTPVSALIHAATMVTAGVYLIARMNPLFSYAHDIQHLIVLIGVAGLLMAGYIALSQTDIKRVIAYSTMSQIAYMFVGVGLGAYSAGIYHLMTHAFFKALLFMGAGVVIHALAGEQDLRRMGGMARWLPKTYICMWIGTLALVGIFPLSGSMSKDLILGSGLQVGGTWGNLAFFGGVLGALLTGIYAFRMLFLAFRGEPSELAAEEAPHHTEHGEGPWTMLWPVYVLAVLSAIAGVLNIPGATHTITTWLETTNYDAKAFVDPSTSNDWIATIVANVAGLAGTAVAFRLYWQGRTAPVKVPQPLRLLSERKFYFDELYDVVFYRPAAWLSVALARYIDRPLILAPVDEVGSFSQLLSRTISIVQTGVVRLYVFVFALGVAGMVLYFMVQA